MKPRRAWKRWKPKEITTPAPCVFCGEACRSGVRRSHLISYQEDGPLLQELFSRDGIGTQIVMESAEQIRRATINDIGGILELIRPLEQQGILVRRSREQLEMEIDKFTIIQRDNLTIACAALYPFPEEDRRNGLRGGAS
jgi:amino-acid N-acetyltransferase